MFEDPKDYEMSNQDPCCRTLPKNTLLEDPKPNAIEERCKIGETNHSKIIEAARNSIVDELIDDAILELCFETHRAAKLNFPAPDNFTSLPDKLTQSSGKSVKATSKFIFCFECGKHRGTNKFTTHLVECMNGLEGNSRKARTKMLNFKESSEDEDDDSTKKKRNKKGSRGKSKLLGNAVSKPAYNSAPSYMDMSYDERKIFLNSKCGVVSRRTKKMCQNSRNCATHTDIQKTSVRCNLLSEMVDESDNGQIDIDTVEEDISDIIPSYSADEGSISTITGLTCFQISSDLITDSC